MGLKIELKPGERVMLGDCVITNHDHHTRLLVEGTAPILREKDIMTERRADTPAKRIYFAVQLMYISKNPATYHEPYFNLVRDITQAAPSMWPLIESINKSDKNTIDKCVYLAQEIWIHQPFVDGNKRTGRLWYYPYLLA